MRQLALSLLLAGLAATVLVGAFDPTIQDEEDIRRAGFMSVSTVQASKGQASHTEV